MSSLKVIAEAWYNYVKATPEVKEMIRKRLDVCDTCPNKVQISPVGVKIMKALNDVNNTFKCGLCNCLLSAMAAHPVPQCKANKW